MELFLFQIQMNAKNVCTIAFAILVSLAWLIPNHYQPWANFHSDAWSAIVCLIASISLIFYGNKVITWPRFAVVTFLLCFVPWIQYAFGLLIFESQAWITSSYLLGFSLAIVVGANFEQRSSDTLANALFGAIVLASFASVGLSLGSWAEVIDTGLNDYLSMGYSAGRYYANIGQPNLLATLLLWGILGCFWFYSKKSVNLPITLISSAFILLGIILTQSRTAYLSGLVALITLIAYRRLIKSSGTLYLGFILFILFFLGAYLFQWMDAAFFNRNDDTTYVRGDFQSNIRLMAWTLFADAILVRPWLGYGWTEVVNAQIEVANKYPSLGGMFGHTHNIVLDLFVWIGIPLGILLIILFAIYSLRLLKSTTNEQSLLILISLIVIGVHSMLEYPLQYAIFLVPAGMFVGIIDAKNRMQFEKISTKYFAGLLLASILLLFGLINDYLNIEKSFNKWRFDRAGLTYPFKDTKDIPDVIYLNQFKSWFEIIRIRPSIGMSQLELSKRESVVRAYPSPGAIFELALSYALNGQAEKASFWLTRVCKLSNNFECIALKKAWDSNQEKYPEISHIYWPD